MTNNKIRSIHFDTGEKLFFSKGAKLFIVGWGIATILCSVKLIYIILMSLSFEFIP